VVRMKPDSAEIGGLMDAAAYQKLVG
jgi:hypothetical protein